MSSLDDAPAVRKPPGPRRTGVLLASSAPLEPLATPAVPWPETILSARTGGIALHVAHVPNSRNGWIKVETLEGILAGLARDPAHPSVLCGDFNTPRSERPDGTILTFARDQYGRLRRERGERWDAAELGILTALWPDAFRALHGYERKEISWNWPRFPRSSYRLDHMFSTLAPSRCEYVHEVRTTKLSDHSAMEGDF